MGITLRNGIQYSFGGKVGTASSVLYDPSTSQIEVATVQEAIDYILEHGVKNSLEVDLTKAEYEEMVLQNAILENVTYYLTDDDMVEEVDAKMLRFDNTETDLLTENVQDAIVEVNGKVENLDNSITELSEQVTEQNNKTHIISGGYTFAHQGDGNFVIYDSSNNVVFASNTVLGTINDQYNQVTALSGSLKWTKINTNKTFTNTTSITVGTYSQLKSAKEVIVVFSDEGDAQEVHKHLINTGGKVICEYQILAMNGYTDTYWNYSRSAWAKIDFSTGEVTAQQIYKGGGVGAYSGIKAIYYR